MVVDGIAKCQALKFTFQGLKFRVKSLVLLVRRRIPQKFQFRAWNLTNPSTTIPYPTFCLPSHATFLQIFLCLAYASYPPDKQASLPRPVKASCTPGLARSSPDPRLDSSQAIFLQHFGSYMSATPNTTHPNKNSLHKQFAQTISGQFVQIVPLFLLK